MPAEDKNASAYERMLADGEFDKYAPGTFVALIQGYLFAVAESEEALRAAMEGSGIKQGYYYRQLGIQEPIPVPSVLGFVEDEE